MKAILFALTIGVSGSIFGQQKWLTNTTPTNDELIAHLQYLDRKHKEIKLYNMGPSDYGQPIYLCVINGARDSLKTFEKARNSTTLLINTPFTRASPTE